jgi:hypothetical protein
MDVKSVAGAGHGGSGIWNVALGGPGRSMRYDAGLRFGAAMIGDFWLWMFLMVFG